MAVYVLIGFFIHFYWKIICILCHNFQYLIMPREKFHIEFVMGSASQASLWKMISKIDGLSQWFADEVEISEDETKYIFHWGKSSNEAEVVYVRPQSNIRYRWMDEEDDQYYFEFRIHKLELSRELALQITDFASPDEKGDAISLWEAQIDEMMRQLGVS